ncbi:Molybdopterin synthase/thiamin biosynthesis sulphur carrier, beta-grasp [Moorella glycerini]|uniref:Bifunctional sulfur carrier protein/thiazole synthase protein n=1 Tax=Neomoorella stamsii TaxID=1266720 RepID=A0A9X7J0Z7_9FIRM|nr:MULTISPECIES: sulfur carrier protein ThiS [Moorella]PRR68879.1 bifunctional sulfur carrier protein/thiazole synthase protein [Moorella stamsii]CEP67500.1 Molybdopterin synthase/thiamin biosynthesis sulphur carrier, beta-grasp [Moorella glycerini]
MTIILNRQEKEVAEGITVKELVEQLNFNPVTVAVEVNGRLLLPEEYNQNLQQGDKVEIVLNMGGGV